MISLMSKVEPRDLWKDINARVVGQTTRYDANGARLWFVENHLRRREKP